MEELIARVSTAAGIEPATAQKAIAIILNFLQKEGPPEAVNALFAEVPGAAEAAAAGANEGGGGALGGLMGMMGGGGIMGVAGKLTSIGLGMGEMQTVGKEIFAFVREKVGDERVGEVAGAIPGLSQFL
jgi:hypothetical protein